MASAMARTLFANSVLSMVFLCAIVGGLDSAPPAVNTKATSPKSQGRDFAYTASTVADPVGPGAAVLLQQHMDSAVLGP